MSEVVYSLSAFGAMIADPDRFAAYSEAIAKAVRHGDVVLEIGCGPAVFALLAARAGARRVFAADTADIVDFARKLAETNGLAERIEFFQCDSRKLTLPEKANVIVSDIRGALPFYDHAIPSIEDARKRLLTPGGVLIPQRDTVKAALIEAADFYSRLTAPWQQSVPALDLSPSLPLILNDSYSSHFKREQLLTDPQTFCVLDYAPGIADSATAELTFTAARGATAHGLCVWFETRLLADIGYSTGPGADKSVYSQTFFPLLEPVVLRPGQQVQVKLRAELVGSDYVWQWDTTFPAAASGERLHFRQSTFHGAHFSPRFLRTRAANFTPELSAEGQADLWLLQAMDGRTPLQQIAETAAERFPQVFNTTADAFNRASALAERVSR
jgi:protein arginine N-methyltransferase 1